MSSDDIETADHHRTAALTKPIRKCTHCGAPLPPGTKFKTCSDECRLARMTHDSVEFRKPCKICGEIPNTRTCRKPLCVIAQERRLNHYFARTKYETKRYLDFRPRRFIKYDLRFAAKYHEARKLGRDRTKNPVLDKLLTQLEARAASMLQPADAMPKHILKQYPETQ